MYTCNSLACPHCSQQDMVQKVSALADNNTVTGVEYGWVVGRTRGRRFTGHTIGWNRQQTMLASLLAPPSKPKPVVGLAALVVLFLLLPSLLCTVSQENTTVAQTSMEVRIFWLVVIGMHLALLLLLLLGVRKNASYSQSAWSEWRRQMQKWQALYYCHRCDGVFIPGLCMFVPIAAVRAFLAQP